MVSPEIKLEDHYETIRESISKMHRWHLNNVGGPDEAFQIACLYILQRLPTYDPNLATIHDWIYAQTYTAVGNASDRENRHRGRVSRARKVIIGNAIAGTKSNGRTWVQRFRRESQHYEVCEYLHTVIVESPDHWRVLLSLTYFGGLSRDNACLQLGIDKYKVYTYRMRLAREHIRQKLIQRFGEEVYEDVDL